MWTILFVVALLDGDVELMRGTRGGFDNYESCMQYGFATARILTPLQPDNTALVWDCDKDITA